MAVPGPGAYKLKSSIGDVPDYSIPNKKDEFKYVWIYLGLNNNQNYKGASKETLSNKWITLKRYKYIWWEIKILCTKLFLFTLNNL